MQRLSQDNACHAVSAFAIRSLTCHKTDARGGFGIIPADVMARALSQHQAQSAATMHTEKFFTANEDISSASFFMSQQMRISLGVLFPTSGDLQGTATTAAAVPG